MQKVILASFLAMLLTGCSTHQTKTTSQTESILLPPLQFDSDKDGIDNNLDQCPNTPTNFVVDNNGCPRIAGIGGLNMEVRIFYPPNQTAISKKPFQLSPDDQPRNSWEELVNLANKAKEYPNADIYIEGGASKSEGKSDKDRMRLSKLRASTIKYTLIQHFGVTQTKIYAIGCGANHPISGDNQPEQKESNRLSYIMMTDEPYILKNYSKNISNNCELADYH